MRNNLLLFIFTILTSFPVFATGKIVNGNYYKLGEFSGLYINRGDSVVLVNNGEKAFSSDSVFWSVTEKREDGSGAYLYRFVNKATSKAISFGSAEYFQPANGGQIVLPDSKEVIGYLKYFQDGEQNYVGRNDKGVLKSFDDENKVVSQSMTISDVEHSRVMTVADLHEQTTYSMDILSSLEGVADGTYYFEEVLDGIFNIKSAKTGNYLSVDSVMVAKSADDAQFGFKFSFKKKEYATARNFTLLLDEATDKVVIAVAGKTFSLVNNEITLSDIVDNVILGKATLGTSESYVTVSFADNAEPKNGEKLSFDRPSFGKSTAWTPSEKAYIITKVATGANAAENGKIWGAEFANLDNAENKLGFVKKQASAYLPETYNYIEKTEDDGKVTYTISNGFYNDSKRVALREVAGKADMFVASLVSDADTFRVKEIDALPGYVNLTEKEAQDTRWSMEIITNLGNNVYVVDKDNYLYGQNLENVSEAYSFRLKIEETLKSPSGKTEFNVYSIQDDEGRKVGFDKNGKMALNNNVAALRFVFKTLADGKQMVIYMSDKEGSTAGAGSLKVDGSQSNIVKLERDGYQWGDYTSFNIVPQEAPVYEVLSEGHYRIQSAFNSSLAIVRDGNKALMKAVSELPEATEDNFKLYVDTVKVKDALKPLYTISASPISGDKNSRAYLCVEEKNGVKSVVFKDYTDAEMEKALDKEELKSVFWSFKIEDDGCLIQNDKTGKYLYQDKESLALSELAGALAFEVERVSAPTSVEAIEELSGVVVTTVNGALVVRNAAGKRILVSDIVGRIVVDKVLTSDNVSLSVPSGIMLVKAGKECFKVIVR
ncbi:MAG: DUF6383 domain-containing protein [Parabacteroides sp.]|nr:DUF6383 domain-containing protein [Parabacteroides sp.]